MRLPTPKDIADRRIAQFKTGLSTTLASEDLDLYARVIDVYREEQGVEWRELGGALTYLAQRQRPFVPTRPKEEEPAAVPTPVEEPSGESATPRAPRCRRHRSRTRASTLIGAITIRRTDSTIEVPAIPRELLRHLKKVRVMGRPLRITPADEVSASR